MNEIKKNWYKDLIQDLKQYTHVKLIELKHAIGKRILQDYDKFGLPEYGSKRIENIAKDLKIGIRDLYYCVQFAEKYSDFARIMQNVSWDYIKNKLLPNEKQKPIIKSFPEDKYQIIYADPAWKYYEGGYKNQEQHYETLEIQYIIDFIDENQKHVKELAANDCILFLWCTSPILPEIPELITSWGFKYSTVGFIWIKSRKDGTGFHFGNGNWTRANAEYCIIAKKGKIKRLDASISQIIYEPKQEHSKKPIIVHNKIIQLVGDLKRIELFAREKIQGWDIWGNEFN